MKILIACECSGVIREAFRAAGHDAWSCDLQAADDGSPFHIQGDALEAARDPSWGMLGFHPECTYMTVAGIHWNNRGRGWEGTEAAVKFSLDLVEAAGSRPFYLENPVGILSSRWRKPDQTIQPYQFGEDASKRTCLWLQGLPLLLDTVRVPGRIVEWPKGSGKQVERWGNQTDSGQNKLAPSPTRSKERSRSYAGIASGMAEQWTLGELPFTLSAA